MRAPGRDRTAGSGSPASAPEVSQMKLPQQVLRDRRAVGGGGAHVGERREIACQRRGGALAGRLVPGLTGERRLALRRALRGRGHPAERDPRRADRAALDSDRERGADRRDVLVEALGDLVGREPQRRRPDRDAHALHEFARLHCRLLVGEIQVLQRQLPARVALAEHDARAEGDQRRHRVADRRAVGDVARERAGVPDRRRSEAAQHLAELRVVLLERRERIGERHRGADVDVVGADRRPSWRSATLPT